MGKTAVIGGSLWVSPYWLGYGERYTFPTLGHRIKPLPVWGREKKKSSGKTDVTDEPDDSSYFSWGYWASAPRQVVPKPKLH